MATVNSNWTDEATGNHDGGVSYGPGYCLSWQRGPLNEADRNGAGLIEVLDACRHQLEYFQNGKFSCEENRLALEKLDEAIAHLESRRDRRTAEGTLGTTEV